MALIEEELEIVSVKNILNKNLTIPTYQRPYRWSVESANTLFIDTYKSYKDKLKEYRLGSVILHKEKIKNKNMYNIVDGQQRITSLTILLYVLNEKENYFFNQNYSELSYDSITKNHEIYSKRVNELEPNDKRNYKKYLLDNCTIVQIVTDKEQEAFQFFDSQNSRGKELDPHDLLKSYHLREMAVDNDNEKIKIINRWEGIQQEKLKDLFGIYLFPIIQWCKKRDGLGYSSKKIDVFKGVSKENRYNYASYHKASHLFVEQFNQENSYEILTSEKINEFQLNQPVLSGKRFFNYVHHYYNLLEKVKLIIEEHPDFSDENQRELIPNNGAGDTYVKQLFECTLLFLADRFGIDCLLDSLIKHVYTWCYSLRLSMFAVYPQSINNYAQGEHERINYGIDLFSIINEMKSPDEINLMIFVKPNCVGNKEGNSKYKYFDIYKYICKINNWVE